jgi:hypothetical protein
LTDGRVNHQRCPFLRADFFNSIETQHGRTSVMELFPARIQRSHTDTVRVTSVMVPEPPRCRR